MGAEDYAVLLNRELESFRSQILSYPDDASVWTTPPGINNSAGTLVLHVSGNLRHFVGAELGESGYVRDREKEFTTRDLSRADLAALLETAVQEVEAALEGAADKELSSSRGLPGGRRTTTARFLAHLCTHTAYHLGQLDYHRRITLGLGPVEGTLALAPLDTSS